MIGTLLAVMLIIAAGGRAVDNLRIAQLESILGRLPEAEARAYYDLIRRRVRRVVVMRALALASLACIFYALRQLLIRHAT